MYVVFKYLLPAALLAVLELGLRVDPQMDVTAVSTAAAAIKLLARQHGPRMGG